MLFLIVMRINNVFVSYFSYSKTCCIFSQGMENSLLEGKTKLLELMHNHIVSTSQLSASFIVSNLRAVTLADQVLTFNVTTAG
ncbi:uncharacterized protein LOC113056168 isoform X2 [Carassius auratus]|uniref:Uncharacterized protein LOC113056168 isoform X2 n=1 Tax=Carassius auratus TaxID=7957 RepID=A0A6P6L1U8_CARAU|nr:uncharacterized protein LOC113056168 isoform X2 [Carassius auratus]